MADYVLILGICQWQNGIQISVRHLDEISGVAEDDAMEVFENDYYLELQRHKATVSRANHEAYPLQQKANAKLLEYARKYDIKGY